MAALFKSIRAGERRDTWAGFLCLFALIGSHSILETARDALFLSKIPPSRLPWMYLAIAAVSLLVTQFQSRVSRALSGRAALATWTLVAAAVTGGFYFAFDGMGDGSLYALYIWSGVLTTLVLVHLWNLLGDLFSVTQAKRVYGIIGAGSVLGAIVGSAMASALARMVAAETLVLVAAGGFATAALVPSLFSSGGAKADTSSPPSSLLENASYVARSPYARRVALLLVAAAATVTVADYLFKSTVASMGMPAEELGAYLASVYLVLNVLSLVAQLFIVGFILRRFDISAALALLPALLLIGAGMMVVSVGIVAALAIKGADGSLRYSVNRTATELLFVPMSEGARRRLKAFIDVVGQRGGQAVASLAILGMTALELNFHIVAGLLVGLALVWIACAVGLRRHYLDLFRSRVRGEQTMYLDEFPDLDVSSLETLIAALDSPNDQEVIAALRILEQEKKTRLVPALILYHPGEEVVLAALELFTRSKRKNAIPVIDRLLENPSPRIRSAAIASRSVIHPDERFLRMRLSYEESAEVRATIMVNLIASGDLVGADADDALEAILQSNSVPAKVALGEAIARRRVLGFTRTLISLAADLDSDVRVAAATAMKRGLDPAVLPVLIDLLGDEAARDTAAEALLAFGDDAFDALREALEGHDLPDKVRWRVPRTIARFEPNRAASLLLSNLPKEQDGMVRFQSIRFLSQLIHVDPGISLDHELLDVAIRNTVERAYRYLDRYMTLLEGGEAEPKRKTEGFELLAKMLRDKRAHCIDRLFGLLDLKYPGQDFLAIHRGLSSRVRETRAGSVELVENLLPPPLRGAVVGLIDDMSDIDRLDLGSEYHRRLGLSYADLLLHMLNSSSEIVQDMTAFHLTELGESSFIGKLSKIADERWSPDVQRAVSELETASHGAA